MSGHIVPVVRTQGETDAWAPAPFLSDTLLNPILPVRNQEQGQWCAGSVHLRVRSLVILYRPAQRWVSSVGSKAHQTDKQDKWNDGSLDPACEVQWACESQARLSSNCNGGSGRSAEPGVRVHIGLGNRTLLQHALVKVNAGGSGTAYI